MAPAASGNSRGSDAWRGLLAGGAAVFAVAAALSGAALLAPRFARSADRRKGSAGKCGGSCNGGCGENSDCGGAEDGAERDEDLRDDSEPDLEDIGASAPDADPERESWGTGVVKQSLRPRQRNATAEPDAQDDLAENSLVPGRQRIFVKTYGCAHNNSDSEFMMGLLRDYGYSLVNKLEDADACIVNSCTVKNPSQDTAITLTKKAREAGKPVVLAGCVPTADASLANGLEDVSMLGVTQLDRVVEVVDEALQGHVVKMLGQRRALPSLDLPKVRKNKYVEIIPISGGCLGNCSYCKTKHARGKLSSYAEDAIVGRALRAAAEGVSEIWLTSEDTGAYGIDIGTSIALLLRRVADAVPAGVMLKLGMTNPPYMLAHVDAVADVLRRPNFFEFIHIPVQSGSDSVLQAMVREYTVENFRRLADSLRDAVPDILIATDIICGFPTESEEDHRESLALVEAYKFPVLNISQFYPRPGTAAARMKKLQGNVVKRRSTDMTNLFNSYSTFEGLVGRQERAWFSDTDVQRGQTVGHTKGYAKVVVPRDDALLGRSAEVRIHAATKWHVDAEVVGELR
mmetsp:Transcript_111002/g.312979  ORF Transcript_111002/g.312979 Transcript_111002/m.312979 type:complete len:572 (-) Transcript_111002:217-1932(-)